MSTERDAQYIHVLDTALHWCMQGGVFSSIMSCSTVQELRKVVDTRHQEMRPKDITTAMNRLVQLRPSTAAATPLLEKLYAQLQQQWGLGRCLPIDLSRVLWACSKLGFKGNSLYKDVLKVFIAKAAQATPRELSNVVYAFANRGQLMTDADLQQLLGLLVIRLAQANPQDINNVLWAVATMQRQPSEAQLQQECLQQLLRAFCSQVDSAKPQDVANTLWAVAKMQGQLFDAELQQLLKRLCSQADIAKPQAVSNTFWAVATMQMQISEAHLQELLKSFCSQLRSAKPQEISNVLIAMAKLQQRVPRQQLEQLLDALCQKPASTNPQDVSNTLWACAKLNFYPQGVLKAWDCAQHVGSMKMQEVSNTGLALAVFGHIDVELMGALLSRGNEIIKESRAKMISQNFANLAWSVAVLDHKELSPQLQPLVLACFAAPEQLVKEDLRNMFQVHIWMCDAGLFDGQGLAGSGWVTQEQLQQCEEAWREQVVESQPSRLQRDVYKQLQGFVGTLSGFDVKGMEVLDQRDELFSIDVVAEYKGQLIAIEVDGPWHFLSPDMRVTGDTMFRNRCLEARGYTVLSVPVHVWRKLNGSQDKQQWLQQHLDALV